MTTFNIDYGVKTEFQAFIGNTTFSNKCLYRDSLSIVKDFEETELVQYLKEDPANLLNDQQKEQVANDVKNVVDKICVFVNYLHMYADDIGEYNSAQERFHDWMTYSGDAQSDEEFLECIRNLKNNIVYKYQHESYEQSVDEIINALIKDEQEALASLVMSLNNLRIVYVASKVRKFLLKK